jgi:hypothetical protein
VAPNRRSWLHAGDDHVPECDRTETALGQHAIRETAIADIKKATIATPRAREGQQPQDVPEGIGVVRDEDSAEIQGMVATTSSTAATTRSRVVRVESK